MSSEAQIIPDDIRAVAEFVAVEAYRNSVDIEEMKTAIGRAILAERERCALIVEGHPKKFSFARELSDLGVRVLDTQYQRLRFSDAIRAAQKAEG